MRLVRDGVLLALCAATLGVAGCSSGSSSANPGPTSGASTAASPSASGSSTASAPTGSASAHPHPSTVDRIPPPKPTVAVGKGYASSEKYCAASPASGTISYAVTAGKATVKLAVSGLPANTALAILWQTSDGNGRSIGAFDTDSSGAAVQASLHLFVSPSSRGDQVQLTKSDGTAVAELNRC